MSVVIIVVFVILLIAFMANRVVKTSQQAKGEGRCHYCRARLKFMGVGKAGQAGVGAGYATTCARCGQEQPWSSER